MIAEVKPGWLITNAIARAIIARTATAANCWCFFFSSRRRYTRGECDWSSDVCSSDLSTRLNSSHTLISSEDGIRDESVTGVQTCALCADRHTRSVGAPGREVAGR